eukprot:1312971-Pyramimonas_sp.AAC.1
MAVVAAVLVAAHTKRVHFAATGVSTSTAMLAAASAAAATSTTVAPATPRCPTLRSLPATSRSWPRSALK